MIEFTHTDVTNFDGALRGARNSWESHDKSDSEWFAESGEWWFELGPNDYALLMKLSKAGSSHAKFMRQILVSVDINAPLYWYKEFDQYKVGTVTNSESTMHRITSKQFTKEMFSFDDFEEETDYMDIIESLEFVRKMYLETKDKKYWRYLIQVLPSGWMQKRTTTLNYAVLANIYHDRRNHKLQEWRDMCNWIITLPYSELIVGECHEKAE